MKHSKSYKKKITTKKQKKTRKNKSVNEMYSKTDLYPPIVFNEEYFLKVSNLHTIYISTYGNIRGKPVLYVHGGPGAGTNPDMARFFNPKKYFIVLVDQRGCGKSLPNSELRENTTSHLISDFEKVRKMLKIKKWMVYGGSWGSTLSLAYAMQCPSKTTELVVRGVYFCTDKENHWISEPNGAEYFNPEGWNYYSSKIPNKPKKSLFMKEYKKCFSGKLGDKRKNECLLAWNVWEASLSSLNPKPLKKLIADIRKENFQQMSLIENHYFSNNCFFTEGYFLKKKNLDKIKNIPITIVQGLYDLVCPYITAYKLHKALPHSVFYPTIAGHTAMDTENIKYLVKATDYYAS